MVRLAPLTEEAFATWRRDAIPAYAQDKVEAGNWLPEVALERSEAEFSRFLPEGLATPDQHFFSIVDAATGNQVGVVWFAVADWSGRRAAFILDFLVYEPFRRHGFAFQALSALEAEVRALGLDTMELHVFGHNRAARALYEKAGFEVTNVNMAKHLPPMAASSS